MKNVEAMTLTELETYIAKRGRKNWLAISRNLNLTEEFIEQHADEIDWYYISIYQKLSEKFIEKHVEEVYWYLVSIYQKLSEEFIERHAGEVDWNRISMYQKLSEKFIEKHADKVNWYCISKYQKLSEKFIEKHADVLNMSNIDDSWNYKSTDFKKAAVEATGLYECHEDFFYAYKGIRSDRYSRLNFQYRYMPNETYECFADTSSEENSFGLSAWTKERAEEYCSALVVKVKIYYKDVARVVHNGGKIRCSRLTVMD